MPASSDAPTGRPFTFTPDVAATICTRLAEGQSLREICRDPAMPGRSTVDDWLRRNSEFAIQFAEAKAQGIGALADQLLEFADDRSNDTYTDAGGNRVVNFDHIQRSKLRVDTRVREAGGDGGIDARGHGR